MGKPLCSQEKMNDVKNDGPRQMSNLQDVTKFIKLTTLQNQMNNFTIRVKHLQVGYPSKMFDQCIAMKADIIKPCTTLILLFAPESKLGTNSSNNCCFTVT